MNKLITDIDLVLRGSAGSTVVLKANEETIVPERFYNAAIEAGAKVVGGSEAAVKPATDKLAIVKSAIEQLAEVGDPKSFELRTGKPKLSAIKAITGFSVTNTIRDEALED